MQSTKRRPQIIEVVDPPVEELGPSMQALTPLQRRFVIAYIAQDGKNASQAARIAGYSSKGATERALAFNMLRNPKITKAMQEEAGRTLQSLSLYAAIVLKQNMIRGNAKSRQNAADSILDRTGFPRRMEKDVRVDDTRPHRAHEQLLALVYEKLKGHSIEAKELPAPVDASFKQVEEGREAAISDEALDTATARDEDEQR